MPGQSLFEVSEDILALDDLIQEFEGNLDDPEVVKALESLEAEIVGNMEMKADNYAAFIKTLVSRANVRKAEADRLAARAKTDKNTAKRLADRLKFIFERHGVTRLDTARFRLGIVNNGGEIPLIVEARPESLPEEYRVTKTEVVPDTKAIREALAAGKTVPGCRLGERGRRLSIR